MQITRQHETTTIVELSGAVCTKLLGDGPGTSGGVHVWYLEANDTWYRFFIHLGILFWVTAAPDPEDDLEEGEDYVDVLEQNSVTKTAEIEAVEMNDGRLTIAFSGGRKLIIEEIEATGSMAIT